MSDGSGGGGFSKIGGLVSEAVVKPVKDEVGLALETAISSITGQGTMAATPQDPDQAAKIQQEQTQRTREEEQKKANLRSFIQRSEVDEQRFTTQKQKDTQQKYQKQQEQQQQNQVRQFEVMKKQERAQSINLVSAKNKEIKGGVGG